MAGCLWRELQANVIDLRQVIAGIRQMIGL